jgi:serine acetyltransferase
MSQTFQFSQPIKQFFLRLEGIKIGKNVQIMPDVFFDIFFPWQITIEDDVVIGISSFISCHEFTPTEFKYGDVLIKKGVLIGAKSFILPGVIIGEGAFISPLTTVYKDIPDHVLAFGSPLQFKAMEVKPPVQVSSETNSPQLKSINIVASETVATTAPVTASTSGTTDVPKQPETVLPVQN